MIQNGLVARARELDGLLSARRFSQMRALVRAILGDEALARAAAASGDYLNVARLLRTLQDCGASAVDLADFARKVDGAASHQTVSRFVAQGLVEAGHFADAIMLLREAEKAQAALRIPHRNDEEESPALRSAETRFLLARAYHGLYLSGRPNRSVWREDDFSEARRQYQNALAGAPEIEFTCKVIVYSLALVSRHMTVLRDAVNSAKSDDGGAAYSQLQDCANYCEECSSVLNERCDLAAPTAQFGPWQAVGAIVAGLTDQNKYNVAINAAVEFLFGEEDRCRFTPGMLACLWQLLAGLWQLDPDSPPGSMVFPLIDSRMCECGFVTSVGAGGRYLDTLRAFCEQRQELSWPRNLLMLHGLCDHVARIEARGMKGVLRGLGCLVSPASVNLMVARGASVVITRALTVTHDPDQRDECRSCGVETLTFPEAEVVLRRGFAGAERRSGVTEVLWSSPPRDLDLSLLEGNLGAVPGELRPVIRQHPQVGQVVFQIGYSDDMDHLLVQSNQIASVGAPPSSFTYVAPTCFRRDLCGPVVDEQGNWVGFHRARVGTLEQAVDLKAAAKRVEDLTGSVVYDKGAVSDPADAFIQEMRLDNAERFVHEFVARMCERVEDFELFDFDPSLIGAGEERYSRLVGSVMSSHGQAAGGSTSRVDFIETADGQRYAAKRLNTADRYYDFQSVENQLACLWAEGSKTAAIHGPSGPDFYRGVYWATSGPRGEIRALYEMSSGFQPGRFPVLVMERLPGNQTLRELAVARRWDAVFHRDEDLLPLFAKALDLATRGKNVSASIHRRLQSLDAWQLMMVYRTPLDCHQLLEDNPEARSHVFEYLRRADWFVSKHKTKLIQLPWCDYHGDVKPDSTFVCSENEIAAPDGQALIIRQGALRVGLGEEGSVKNARPIVAPWPCSPKVFQAAYLLAELEVVGRGHLRRELWRRYNNEPHSRHWLAQRELPFEGRLCLMAEAYRSVVYVFIYNCRRRNFPEASYHQICEARDYEKQFAKRAASLAVEAAGAMPSDWQLSRPETMKPPS